MDKPTTIRDKSEELNKRIEDLEKEFTSTLPLLSRSGWYYVAGLLGIPFIVFLFLVYFRPFFVLTRRKEGAVRDRKKLVRWTLVFTLVVYSAIYFYVCYKSKASASRSPEGAISFSPELLKS